MSQIFFIIYNIIIVPLLFVSVHIAGLFNAKIKKGLVGRRGLFLKLKTRIDTLAEGQPRIWMHISSAGEFEQGKPVIEEFKKHFPQGQVVLSFFSPSGYEHVRVNDDKIIITYLPIDSYWHARKFIDIVNPAIACVIRHDIWPNFQWRLRKCNIPSFLIDASISDEKRKVYKFFAFLYRIVYSTFTNVFAVSDKNALLLKSVYPWPDRLIAVGDTRYDQVGYRTCETGKIDPLLKAGYFDINTTMVAGSTWTTDNEHLLPALQQILHEFPDFKVVIVPHELTPQNVNNILVFFQKAGVAIERYSQLGPSGNWNFRILLVDAFGLLANLYALGKLAYIGGGFGLGVNSVLEPAAYGCSVFFGPRHLNVIEAKALKDRGGALVIHNQTEIEQVIRDFLNDPGSGEQRGQIAKKMIVENIGASKKVLEIMIKSSLQLRD
ncbi:MAG: hypothetical protein GWP06_15150 [Actinobacteria bacterium]|nr:hypothetical protein [Actinomycetota bacterium]